MPRRLRVTRVRVDPVAHCAASKFLSGHWEPHRLAQTDFLQTRFSLLRACAQTEPADGDAPAANNISCTLHSETPEDPGYQGGKTSAFFPFRMAAI